MNASGLLHVRAILRCRVSAATALIRVSSSSGRTAFSSISAHHHHHHHYPAALAKTLACRVAAAPTTAAGTAAATTRRVFFCTVPARRAADSSSSSVGQTPKKLVYPERLIIYHAGTGRTTFLACLKLTTLFVFVFFDLLLAPSYLAAHEPLLKVLGVALSGAVPLLFVSYTTTPWVAAIHLRLPGWARASPDALRRFARRPPPDARLDVATVGPLGRPRVTPVRVGDWRPVRLPNAGTGDDGWRARLGLVTHVRKGAANEDAVGKSAAASSSTGRWWRRRPLDAFNAPAGGETSSSSSSSSSGGNVPSGWVWRDLAAAMAEQK